MVLELLTTPAATERFACPVPGCSSKLSISAEMCRFGHGARAMCEGGHQGKWCNVAYAFIACELWGEHLSYCCGRELQACRPCIDAAEVRADLAERGADAADGPDDPTDPAASDAGADDELHKEQIADGFDRDILGIVAREVKRHRRSIESGDSEHTQWWGDRLRELQRQTVIR